MKPNGTRVGYADALARECNNPWAAAYVRTILQKEPDIMEKTFLGKSGDLTWYRCTTKKVLPKEGHTLAELPMAKVFNETGIGTMNTSLGDIDKNAMLSFRSSSYGSTSHALANQNAFNTFYGGKAIFYSSGHRTGFTDDHCMYSYRNTRAHNSILVNGMTQKIGTEGYGWIPRWYEGEKIAYMVGDASNAYGKVTSPLWLKRGELSGTQYMQFGGMNAAESNKEQIINGGLILDMKGKRMMVDGEPVKLTATEYKIVSLLMNNLGRVFSADEIYERVWNEEAYATENTVMVHIRRIREKIEIDAKNPRYLKVVWGIGYKIEKMD